MRATGIFGRPFSSRNSSNTASNDETLMFTGVNMPPSAMQVTAEEKRTVPFLRLCSFISHTAQFSGAASILINLMMLVCIKMEVSHPHTHVHFSAEKFPDPVK
jgi:hypothetical protein